MATQLGCPICHHLFLYNPKNYQTETPTCQCGNKQEFISWAGKPEWEQTQAKEWEAANLLITKEEVAPITERSPVSIPSLLMSSCRYYSGIIVRCPLPSHPHYDQVNGCPSCR